MKKRLDTLLVEKGIARSRERAKAYIMAGSITIDGETVRKPSALVDELSCINRVRANEGYVSRGGMKLEGALDDFGIEVNGKRCLDVGASTGGFTHCLLEHGAGSVLALDIGKNLLDYKIRNDRRVTVLEKFNARNIDRLDIEEYGHLTPFDIVTIDVSFISLRLILPPLIKIVTEEAAVLALIKPQFEIKKPYRGFKGVVRDPNVHLEVLKAMNYFIFKTGYTVVGYTVSRLRGPKGNVEFFACIKKAAEGGLPPGSSPDGRKPLERMEAAIEALVARVEDNKKHP
ncbi:MAG: TlyA family RNA methyltransferase [Spirochaetes bacterium]|nr:TlyA family RNA methyltransferase [Spirochaetota bacterium]